MGYSATKKTINTCEIKPQEKTQTNNKSNSLHGLRFIHLMGFHSQHKMSFIIPEVQSSVHGIENVEKWCAKERLIITGKE